jgi:hypothetical protein
MPPPSPCPSLHDLRLYFLGEAPEEEAEILVRHLPDCGGCLQVLLTLQVEDPLLSALQDSPGSLPPDAVVEALIANLKRRLAPAAPTPETST